jgi:serine/threonine protein kinase
MIFLYRDSVAVELEKMETSTLFNIAAEMGHLTEKQTRHIAVQLVQCLSHMNRYDLAHRDIKLSNICFPYYLSSSQHFNPDGSPPLTLTKKSTKTKSGNTLEKYHKYKSKEDHKVIPFLHYYQQKLNHLQFTIKLIDFGMAGCNQEDGLLRGRCGTIGCVAPEILNANQNEGYTLACDMYSVSLLTCFDSNDCVGRSCLVHSIHWI